MFRVSTDGRELFCRFPFALLGDFKQMIHQDERSWCKVRQVWLLTWHGFDMLCEKAPRRLAPLHESVLDVRFPAAVPVAPHVRMAGNGRAA